MEYTHPIVIKKEERCYELLDSYSVLKNGSVAHGIVITSPSVIILLSAIIEPLVAFARVSSAFPNNSLALSLSKAKYKMRKKRFCQNHEREN